MQDDKGSVPHEHVNVCVKRERKGAHALVMQETNSSVPGLTWPKLHRTSKKREMGGSVKEVAEPEKMPKTWVRAPVSAETADREKEPVVV